MHSDRFWAHLWNMVNSGQVYNAVINNRAKDGSLYWVDTTITPYKNVNGEVEKFIVIRHDVTDLVRTRIELQERNDELRKLKHDLTEENRALVALSNTDALT